MAKRLPMRFMAPKTLFVDPIFLKEKCWLCTFFLRGFGVPISPRGSAAFGEVPRRRAVWAPHLFLVALTPRNHATLTMVILMASFKR